MNPCPNRRHALAMLALDELTRAEASEINAHIQTCHGCRAYLGELSSVSEKLRSIEPQVQVKASNKFHANVARAVLNAASKAQPGFAEPWKWILDWRVVVPALCAAVALIVITSAPQPSTSNPPRAVSDLADLRPSAANYRLAATRSSEALDKLLTAQNEHFSSAPVYTASEFTEMLK